MMRKRLLSRSSSLLKSCTNSMEIHSWNSISLISFLQWCGKRGPIGIKNVELSTSQNIMSSIEKERVPKWAFLRGRGAVWYGFVLVGQQSGLGANGMMLENIDPFASNHPTNQPYSKNETSQIWISRTASASEMEYARSTKSSCG